MEMEVLGSSSPSCCGDRNCVGYMIINEKGKILLDCGNGITRFMIIPDDLENLVIVISHMHSDHYGDLLSLAYESFIAHNLGYLNERIKVYIPEPDFIGHNVFNFHLNEYEWYKNIREDKEVLDYLFLTRFGDEHYLEFITYHSGTKLELFDINIEFTQTIHPIRTYAMRLEDKDGVLFYSADTGYDKGIFHEFAKDSNILLCESTFIKGQARVKNNHLFAHEAAMIARDLMVDQLILTHFYPRIDKSLYLEEAKKIFPNTIVAEEGKVIKVKKL